MTISKFKISNRILSLVLALVMVLGMMPMMSMTAQAAVDQYTLSETKYGFVINLEYNNTRFKFLSLELNDITIKNGTAVVTVRTTWAQGKPKYTDKDFEITDYSCNREINFEVSEIGAVASWTGSIKRSPGHFYETSKKKDENNHISTCVLCKHETTEAHVFSNDCDTSCNECGYTRTIQHSTAYFASGNTITETCSKNCGHSVEAKLTAADTYYTGAPIITGATIAYPNGWQGEQKQPSEIADTEYTNNINAGTATVKTTVEGKELTTTFEINPATITDEMVTLSPENGTYTGSAYAPSVNVTFNGAPLVKDRDYTISWDDKNGFTDADDYTVRIVGIYNFTGFVDKTFTINEASLSDVKVEQDGTLTYNGLEQTPDVSKSATSVNNQTITFAYSTEKGNYGDMPSFTNAGTYTVYYEAKADNHTAAYGEFKVTINKQTVDVPNISDKVYNGETQTADIESTDLYTVTENNGGTDAGKYNVELTLTDSTNYKWKNTNDAAVTLDFEITKATNKWMTDPTISDWTYGGTASTPNYKAKFGTVVVTYKGKTYGDKDYAESTTPPTEAGNYTATFTVTGNDNYTALTEDVSFTIAKKTVNLSGVKWNYPEAFKYDGKSHGVSIDESTLPEGTYISNYTGHSGIEVGKRQAAAAIVYDDNHTGEATLFLDWEIKNDWTPTEYTVTKLNDNGWINGDFEIIPQDGYKIATDNKDTSVWSDKLTYSAETDSGKVTFYLRNEENDEISLAKTVNYKLDTTNPTGTVEHVGKSLWERFVDIITFNRFLKDEVTVKAEATDALSEVASIDYYTTSAALTLEEVKDITEWTAMPENGVGVSVEDAKQFVYYIRITDNAGNVTYLSTDGAEYDTTAPKIEGVENSSIYYVTQKVTVTDKNLDTDTVTLNDTPVTLDESGSFTLTGNTDAQYKIVAADVAGNSTTVTVTMKAISEVKVPIDALTTDNVKSADNETVQGVIDHIETPMLPTAKRQS